MEEIQYIGEHLWPGRLGHFFVLLGFVAGLFSALTYFFATNNKENTTYSTWRRLGRIGFGIHGFSIYAVIGLIFYIMANQYYEYQYVQAHVSEDLPMEYIFSAFWEGQEGSFLLWMFWHIALGLVLMFTAKNWEAPVMSILATIQVFIGSMILGLYFGIGEWEFKIGSNPTLLLREVMDAPIFAQADYVSLIKGTGLNPLLQNYWMTIHPPTLFLGFASTAVPFCFAIAGLWTKEHKSWLKPAMPWALFSGGILGTGILMGGAWAYEALSFGGYWAWDPVENMSLVPWLILIGGIHTNLVAKNTGHAIRATYVYYLLTFLFIVYSTFLTRSGVLGETSVHAFTEMGLEWQLILFIAFYLGLSAFLLAINYRSIPTPKKEEPVASKEFWMFIGTLVLLFSALIITGSTSLPVFNKIAQFFNPDFKGRVITDPIPHYNKFQLWIGVFIGILSGGAQYLRFKEFNWKKFAPKFYLHTGVAVAISALLTYLTSLWVEVGAWQYALLLFSGIYGVVTNLDYVITFLKGNLKLAGSVFSHVGFGLMVVGIIASGLNQRVISSNPFIMDGLIAGDEEESHRTNILLLKGSPMVMEDYEVTYVSDTMDLFSRTYEVNYKRRNTSGEVVEDFNLYPNILYDKSFTKVAASNPSTKRYPAKDVFTHITSLPQVEMDFEYRRQREDSLNYKGVNVPIGEVGVLLDTLPMEEQDTFVLRQYQIGVESIDMSPKSEDYEPEPTDLAIGATVKVQRQGEPDVYTVQPILVLRNNLLYSYPAQINELNARVRLNEQVFEQVFTPENELDYREFSLKQGEKVNLNGLEINFQGFNRKPGHPNYKAEEGDIAVSAILNVQGRDGQLYAAEPVYFIRGNRPFNLKDQITPLGLHFRFVNLNPKEENISLLIAQKELDNPKVPVELATNAYRSDWIVLKAIEFPGINFFWIGSIMMMLGMFVSMGHRMSQRA